MDDREKTCNHAHVQEGRAQHSIASGIRDLLVHYFHMQIDVLLTSTE